MSGTSFDNMDNVTFFNQVLLAAKSGHEELMILTAQAGGLTKVSEPVYEAALIEMENRINKVAELDKLLCGADVRYFIVLDSDPLAPVTSNGTHDARSELFVSLDEAKADADGAIEEGFKEATVYELVGLSVKIAYRAVEAS
ncbi:hypothetical protein OTK49_02845 [Vibrio coralliirubri]|uniref:hypothetical protein n=1 Tax=Vibrio coralliirubri TaxID=1516159 RepID=UPI0022852994|nr:hypothetical protein [Vibrio coralliirubri]MCY9861456.1 hypothetical protein [Vibrio coralliirubri]